MRVAHIMLSKNLGGAEKSYIDIVNCLALQKIQVLAVGVWGGKAANYFINDLSIIKKKIVCLNSYDYLALLQILYNIKIFRPDLIHCHLARATKFGSVVGRILSIPVVSKTHNLVNPKYYRNCTRIVVTTEAQRMHMIKNGFDNERVTKIPNFRNLSKTSLDPKNYKPKTNQPNFVIKALGRFVKKKGFSNLINAVIKLRNQGIPITFYLAGAGTEKNMLQRMIKDSRYRDDILLVDWVDDVELFLKDADLFVLPSLDEPFGLVILEAMSAGIPILSTKTQGPLEILTEDNAYFLDSPDYLEIADKIKIIMQDVERFSKAVRAKNEFINKYSEKAVIPLYRDLYEKLLSH